MLDFLGSQRAGEEGAFAVGEPLLEHLVAAEFVAPDVGGDVAPEGVGVQVDVEGGVAQGGEGGGEGGAFFRGVGAFGGAALAGHDGAAGAEVAPAGGEGEVVACHVAAARGGGDGDGGGFRAQGAGGDAGDGGFGVEEGGECAAAFGGAGEGCRRVVAFAVGPAGEGDAGPFHAQRAGVGLAVGGVVEGGEDVVEQVFDIETEAVEVAACGSGDVGAAARVFAVVAEPRGKETS